MLIKSVLNELGDKTALFQLNCEQEKKLKELLLDMCVDVFSFCEKNNMVCMLGGGSALGAVRHNGFIPWDDDIDLNMPREDYNKFIPMFAECYKEKYEVYAPDGNRLAATVSAKISMKGTILEDIFHVGDSIKMGVNLDIFPIENVPENRFIAKVKGNISNIFQIAVVSAFYYQCRSDKMKTLFYGSKKTRIIYLCRCFLGLLMSWRSYQWWFAKYDKFVQTKGETKKVTIPTGQKHYFGEMMDKSIIFPLKLAKFENYEFPVYGKVEEYLTMLYGDYMKIPPAEKREKHFYTNVKLD